MRNPLSCAWFKKTTLTIAFSFVLAFFNANQAADLYWIGGTSDFHLVGNWSYSSGDTSCDCAPTQDDNVFFDANSFTTTNQFVYINNANAYCKNMDWTGVLNNPTLAGGWNIYVYGSLKFDSNMTVTWTGSIDFKSDSMGNTVDFAGHTYLGQYFTFNGNGEWTLLSDVNCNGYMYLNKGTLNTNGINVTSNIFYSTTGDNRTLNLGSSIFTLKTGNASPRWWMNPVNMTINAGTSLITANTTFTFDGGGFTYNDIGVTNGTLRINNNNTFNDLSVSSGDVQIYDNNTFRNITTDGILTSYGNLTFEKGNLNNNAYFNSGTDMDSLVLYSGYQYYFNSGVLNVLNNHIKAQGTCIAPVKLSSFSDGIVATINSTGATSDINYVWFQDLNLTGGATLTANNSIDVGNTTGFIINNPPVQDLYWVGNSGNWSDVSHWSLTSGGAGGACIPGPTDNVIFDANSFSSASQAVTINTAAYFRNMTWTGVTNTPDLSGFSDLHTYGSLAFSSSMNFSHFGWWYFSGNQTNTISLAGKTLAITNFNGTGTWNLADDFSCGTLKFDNGNLITNNYSITCAYFGSTTTNKRSLNLGSSIVSVTGSQPFTYEWEVNSTNFSLTAGTSSIVFTANSANPLDFSGGNLAYYNVSYTGATSPAMLYGNNTYNNISVAGNAILNGNNIFNNAIFSGSTTIYGRNFAKNISFQQDAYLYADNVFKTVTVNGTTNINSGSNTIEKFVLNGSATISTNNRFDTLLLSKGKTYTFGAGSTQIINNLLSADGTCNQNITLLSGTNGVQANFIKTSDNATLNNIIMKDMNASGGAMFTVNNMSDLGNNSGWNISNNASRNLYWVGDAGSWHDSTHWATSSGSAGGNCIPTKYDNVFFDANSFTANYFVTINSPVFCNNMDWTGSGFSSSLSGSGDLNISGSLTLNYDLAPYSGNINFSGENDSTNMLTSNGYKIQLMSNKKISFDGKNVSWKFMDDFYTSANVEVKTGTLNTNNQNATFGSFISSGINDRNISLGSSAITLLSNYNDGVETSSWKLSGSNFTFDGDSSNITFNYNGDIHFYGSDQLYKALTFSNSSGIGYVHGNNTASSIEFSFKGNIDGNNSVTGNVNFTNDGSISGSNNINLCTFGTDGTISGDNQFDTLTLSPGKKYTFSTGSTQSISGYLNAIGASNNYITLMSSAPCTPATITKNGDSLHLEFARILDISFTGTAQFKAYNSLNLQNSTGLNFIDNGARNLYWIGSSGNWYDGSHWSLSSGSATCNCVPDINDNVFFDANSLPGGFSSVTIDENAFCKDMDWSNGTASNSLDGNKDLHLSGSLKLNSTLSWVLNANLHFIGSNTTNVITTNGRNIIPFSDKTIFFECGGGQWLLTDDMIITGYIQLKNATLNTNGKVVQARGFISEGMEPRSLILDSTVFTINNYTSYNGTWISWYVTGSGFSCTPGTSLIKLTYPWVSSFNGGSANYYDLDFKGGSNYGILYDNNTFHDINFEGEGLLIGNNSSHNVTFYKKATISGDNSFNILDLKDEGTISGNCTMDTLILAEQKKFQFGATNTFTFTGDIITTGSCSKQTLIQSSVSGMQTNFLKTTDTLFIKNVSMSDVTAGGGAVFLAENSINGGNNTGWSFPSAGSRNLYWVNGTGYWSDSTHWSATSGGAGGVCIPTPDDNVFFDTSSFNGAGQWVIYDKNAYCKSMDWTGAQYSPMLQGTAELHIYGSLILNANMGFSLSENVYLNSPNAGNVITSNGKTIGFTGMEDMFVIDGDGSWTLTDAFSLSNIFELRKGNLNVNSKNFTCYTFLSAGTQPRALTLGTSQVTITGTSNYNATDYAWWLESSGISFSGNQSTITLSSTGDVNFYGGNQTYKNVNFSNSNGNGTIFNINTFYDVNYFGIGNITGNNTFHDVIFSKNAVSQGNNNFNNVNADADITMNSGTNSFNIFDIKGNGTFNSVNTMDSLLLSKGKTYKLGYNKIQTVTSYLGANGDCKQYVTLTTDSSGMQATLSKPGGTLSVSYCNIKGIIASGSANFNADYSVDFGNNLNWDFGVSNPGRNLYWVGNTGFWSDTMHWATTSGGAGGECHPGPKDNVFFDDNSFIPGVNSVIIDEDGGCHNMTWSGSDYLTSILGNNNMNISGNLLFNDYVKNNLESNFIFSASDTGNTITSSGQYFRETVLFDGMGGSWKLTDPFSTLANIQLISGILNTNNNDLKTTAFISNSVSARGLVLGTSQVFITGASDYSGGSCLSSPWNINPAGFSFQPGSSTLHFTYNIDHCFNGQGLNYYNIDFENGKYTTYLNGNSNYHNVNFFGMSDISGTNNFNNVSAYEWIRISGIPTFHILKLLRDGLFVSSTLSDTLLLNPGMDYYFNPGSTQTINNFLSATGNPGSMISLQSSVSGNISTLSKPSGLVCLDYIELKDMSGTGGAGFYAGTNSNDLGNNTNWNFSPCSFTAFFDKKDIDCFGNNNGVVKILADGGVFPYTYSWSTGSFLDTLSNLTKGTYYVTVTDFNATTLVDSVMIAEPEILAVSLAPVSPYCFGASDGSASATVTGGTLAYSYSWNTLPVQTTSLLNNLIAGTYQVTVTDLNSCTISSEVNLTEPAQLVTGIFSTPPTCYQMSDGSITSNPSGGTTPYSYSWNTTPGQSTVTATNLGSGTYIVTVTDSKGCTVTMDASLTEPSAIYLSSSSTNSNCGQADGSLSVTVDSGGVAPYTYIWSDGVTTANNAGVSAGTYTVTITDTNGCTATASSSVSNNGGPSLAIVDSTNPDCSGGSNGSIEVSATGGTSPYTYLWSTGGNTNLVTGLSAGSYFVTLTDNNGCQTIEEYIINDGYSINISFTSQDPLCNGASTGSLVASPTNGTSPYSFAWSDGQTNATASGLGAGTFTVTVTDSKSCTNSMEGTLTNPAVVTVSATGTNPDCNGGANGSATASGSGGTSPYTYAWGSAPVQTTQIATGLPAGTYNVTGTDNNGCSATTSVSLSNPAGMTLTPSTVSSTCGNADGSASVVVTGGVSPYTYMWSDGNATQTTTATLFASTYTVTVTDNNNCTASANANVSDAGGPTATITSTEPSCNGSSNGSATVSPSGGLSPYTYLWTGGQTASIATGLSAGTYNVTVTDANLCNFNTSVTLSDPTALSASTSGTNPNCNSSSNGSATATPSGGASPYIFQWSNVQVTASAVNLGAGTYFVTVTDVMSCTASSSITLTAPSAVIVTATGTDPVCNGGSTGSATASVSGGTPGYTFLWSGSQTTSTISSLSAGTYTVTATDTKGCTASASVTISDPIAVVIPTIACGVSTISNLQWTWNNVSGAGGYQVSLDGMSWYTPSSGNMGLTHDTAGLGVSVSVTLFVRALVASCSPTGSTNITCTTTACPAITLSMTKTDPTCGNADGSATVSISGGTSPYSRVWNTTETTLSITGLVSGTYSVTVTDANTCSATNNIALNDQGAPTVTLTGTNPDCNSGANGSATVTAAGGTTPYTYLWSNASTATIAVGLSAGTYTCTVSDALGCNANASVILSEPALMVLSTSVTDATCGNSDGTATVSIVSGGTPGFTFIWNDGQTTATATGLTSGNYNVTVTDSNGCTSSAIATVLNIGAPTASTSTTDVSCNGGADGSANVTASGGTSPYTYLWSTGATTAVVSNLTAGIFNVTVTDAVGCDAPASVVITEPALLQSNVTVSNASCDNSQDGNIALSTSGGTTPYSFNWSNSATTEINSNLGVGNYSVTITDSNGCTLETNNISVAFSEVPPVAIFGYTSDELTVTFIDSSSGAINYLWNFGDGDTSIDSAPVHTYSAEGDYSVSMNVTNACGTDVETKIITVKTTKVENLNKAGNDGFVLYPVPASDKLIIQSENPETIEEITLFNIHGKKEKTVRVNTLVNNNSRKNMEVSLTEIPAGSYIVRIKSIGGREWKKLITIIR
ncbi:MAG: hypothetical protein A3G23_11995 [Bacteroidetes bacterium RIFCSPLOWO2_12_FULL_37_12]|nr:MAG: hypothetical protein A3G23_11995 [Bacteroidetes bacterium RIFCSPLOWO2_12_FULL_37_12]